MKQLTLILSCCLFTIVATAGTREKISFNKGWKFSYEDNQYCVEPEFDASEWKDVTLPHDWSVEHEFSKENSGRNAWLPGGVAWYRKTFDVPYEAKGRAIEIQFDGVYKQSTIWLNEQLVGIQHDGYTSFRYDITELLKYGESNTMAVRVDHSYYPNCRWYSGSGIYRNVWLNVRNTTHVETWGTYITTPEINNTEASVQIVTELANMDEAKVLTVETSIFDPLGEKVAEASQELKANRFSNWKTKQKVVVANPQLWSPKTPQKYTVTSLVKEGENILDEYHSSFGIRSLEFDADKGFLLNGENLKIKGVCLHHDAGPIGGAVPHEVWFRRLNELKKLGCNAIRTSHNPPSPEFMDICDELGFLVMDEFVDKWDAPHKRSDAKRNPYYDVPMADPNFKTEWKRNYRETIRRDRNHPSVIIWSVGNENHPPNTLGQNQGLRNYASFVRSMDPTRPVVSGMERGKDKPVAEKVQDIIASCKYMDLIALNYGEQWCKLIHEQNPGKPYVSTESYCYYNSELEKRFSPIERAPWIDVMENDQNMGLFLWVGIDYLGERKDFGGKGSGSGLLDMAGFTKPRAYLYKAFWSDEPTLDIFVYKEDADKLSQRGAWSYPALHQNWNLPKDSIVDLVSYTNCEEVDLYLNKKKIGSQKLVDNPNWIMKWRDVAAEPGTLKAVGKIGGIVVCESAIKTTGKAHHFKMKVYEEDLKSGGTAQVEIQLVDKKGNPIVWDDKTVHFELEGDAKIIGLENGNIADMESYTNKSSRKTFNGKCLCMIQLNKNKSTFKLNVKREGVKEQTLEVK